MATKRNPRPKKGSAYPLDRLQRTLEEAIRVMERERHALEQAHAEEGAGQS